MEVQKKKQHREADQKFEAIIKADNERLQKEQALQKAFARAEALPTASATEQAPEEQEELVEVSESYENEMRICGSGKHPSYSKTEESIG